MKTIIYASLAIVLNAVSGGLLDVAEVLTQCAEAINDLVWRLVGKAKENRMT